MTDRTRIPDASLDPGRVSDAVPGSWVDSWAPAGVRPFLRLSRADRPIGTWLLLLPCWWGLSLAIASDPAGARWGDAWIFAGCAIGAFLMRGAGCTWNDITDRDLDARVDRTRSRPLPSGQITLPWAYCWLVVQSLLAFLILLSFNSTAIFLGIASLLPVAVYPFAKRFTWWPQIFLGIAFNWGALLAWAAHSNSIGASAIALYLSGICWTLFYDTIYAHQDREDDALVGIKSTARLFGRKTKTWMIGFAVCSIGLMWAAAYLAAPRAPSSWAAAFLAVGSLGFAGHLAWQLYRLDIDNRDSCLALFRSNRDAGLIPLAFFGLALAAEGRLGTGF